MKPHPLPGTRPCHLRRHQHNRLPVTLSTTSASAQANEKRDSDFFRVVYFLTCTACATMYFMSGDAVWLFLFLYVCMSTLE